MASSNSIPASTLGEIRAAQRADGLAAVLAIGTANPPHCVPQGDYPDYYFRVTQSDHLTHLKPTFAKLCRISGVERRFFYHTEELLSAQPDMSLEARLEIVAAAAPELAASAAAKAIAEWGRTAADITHLVVTTNAGAHAPGTDVRLVSLLGFRHDVCRTALQLNGCAAGSAALRLAKDFAENNRGARVLVVCVELTVAVFRGPVESDTFDTLISQALFGDGAGAAIVGADPDARERPLFNMVAASQAVIPDTEHVPRMHLGSGGIDWNISNGLPRLAAGIIERCLLDALGDQLTTVVGGVVDWNDLFWAVHPGSGGMLERIGKALRLAPEKLAASRTVVREYGNMLGATVIFVLDEVRRRRINPEGAGAGAGLNEEWGVMIGFGPGFTVEAMLLHAAT
ncbi:bisdemethoxycurcumin synthase-like [Triticum dicoccoides]|uniref:bisdemethoxycurcumin synthase-like n=1 Tax=Triticum dicoccoides TaxID=85692 RepID=UPI00188F921B|nr:bisdemethoxycurcumin synthase-like [Triticum dicoccoides]